MSRAAVLAWLLAVVLAGCTRVSVLLERPMTHQVPLPGQPPSVGLLRVHISDEVLAATPDEFANVQGLVRKVVRDTLATDHIPVVDYLDMDYQVDWRRERQPDGFVRLTLESLPPLPFGVQTSVVALVEVLQWELRPERQPGGATVSTAIVSLLVSTWSREGRPLRTEVVHARAAPGEALWLYSSKDPGGAFEWVEDQGAQPLPDNDIALFWEALRKAVEFHFRQYRQRSHYEFVTLLGSVDEEQLRQSKFSDGQKLQVGRQWAAFTRRRHRYRYCQY